MGKEDVVKCTGIVRDTYRGTKFRVEICDDKGKPTGHLVLATISGKLRLNYIKILKGDKVEVEMSPYDLTAGRIVWRDK